MDFKQTLITAAVQGANQAATDPYWSSVVLLVGNNNPANDTTTLTDQSAAAHTFTRVNTPIFKTAQAPTGMTSSVEYIAAESDYWTSADSADWDFAANPFTIEAWVRLSAATTHRFASQWNTNTAWLFDIDAGSLRILTSDSSDATQGVTYAWSHTANTWYHVAACRDSNTGRLYIDGVQVASGAITHTLRNSTQLLNIGTVNNGTANFMDGYMGPLRITKGTCRYPSGTTFTPPTLPLPTS